MWLNTVWFYLFVLIVCGYVILDGFDIGVGVLYLVFARNDEERRISLNSIGPIWDGNEVWLVVAGGVLFGAFPIVYATLFSGFYSALMLVLLVLILRTVAIEFRSKREAPAWRSTWDAVFFTASAVLAILLGVALGNIVNGVPLDGQGQITIKSILDLLHPFPLLVGAATIAMLALHGSMYLAMKTDGVLQQRVRRSLPLLFGIFAVLGVATALAMVLFEHHVMAVYESVWPLIIPLGAAAAFVACWMLLRRGQDFKAFVCSAAMIVLLILSISIGLYPNLLISSTSSSYNLTLANAASAPATLEVMLVFALIGIPFVLCYTAGVNYIFRGKVKLSPESY
jgi:cytochrome bd ubiquinol oxidase subunit II